MTDHTVEIGKFLKTNKIIYGTDNTIKKLRLGKLAKIYVASNCPKITKEDLSHYAKLSKIEVIELAVPNDELSQICKKPFSISVLSILKE